MGILEWLERRKVRKAFRDFVGPKAVSALNEIAKRQAAGEKFVGKVEAKHFQFVIILLDEAKPDEIPVLISKVAATLLQHHAMLSSVSSSLLVGLLGAPFPKDDSPEIRLKLVGALLQNIGGRVRIAHGQCTGAIGIMGTEGRWTYGEVIPGFSGILKKLLETPIGIAIEVS